jgi:hypothetical protein
MKTATEELVDKFSSFLSNSKFIFYIDIVSHTPYHLINNTNITIRNYLALYILKNIVAQKLDTSFTDTTRKELIVSVWTR